MHLPDIKSESEQLYLSFGMTSSGTDKDCKSQMVSRNTESAALGGDSYESSDIDEMSLSDMERWADIFAPGTSGTPSLCYVEVSSVN